MRDYKKIKAWELADKLTVKIYEATRSYPKEETYGLISQMRRCSVSIPANICEGSARAHQKEYLQYLYIAKSSARELEYYLHLSNKLALKSDDYKSLQTLCTETIHVLYGLIQAVSKQT